MAFLTDQTLLNEIQVAVIEAPDSGATFPSGLWTPAEVLAFLNLRQRRFVTETRVLIGRTNFTLGLGVERVDIEALGGLEDVFQIIRVQYTDAADITHEIPASDLFGADHGSPSWAGSTEDVPLAYSATDGATTTLIFFPAPTAAGTIWLHFVPRLVDLDRTGERLAIPSELSLGVKWGVLADMLGKPGRARGVDARAAYCEARYQEIATLTEELVEGLI